LDSIARHIPVLVCSAWDEPELAYSLGAAAFLKKPVLQKALLDVLYQLNLIQE
jgi:CheY-like chemotaxis protein